MNDPAAGGGLFACECIVPVLAVADLAASLRFYEQVLGFVRDWGGEGAEAHIASVSHQGRSIMLVRGESSGATVWVGVDDVAPLHRHLLAAGVEVLQPPTNRPWALEMRVTDLDRNVLWFGSEPLPEEERPDGS